MAAGALRPVVAVGVVGGEAAELVPGELGGLAFSVRGLQFGGGAGEGSGVPAAGAACWGSTGFRWR
jgi:hypothetical protein